MAYEYLGYLMQLNEIGEITTKYADVFGEIGELEVNNIDELKRKQEMYGAANQGYKICLDKLRRLAPPKAIYKEHEQILSGYAMLVEGVDILKNSIDVEKQEVNNELYQRGINKLKNAAQTVKDATNMIVNKSKLD